jgi:hypothetical protein
MLLAVIDKLFVHLIGDDVKVVSNGKGGNYLQLISGINLTGWIARAVQNERFRPGRKVLFQFRPFKFIVVFLFCIYNYRSSPVEFYKLGVADPVR